MRRIPSALVLGLLLLDPSAAPAQTLAGLCPDGSAFIVHRREHVPCRRAKFVDPSDLPPLRPELLPKPYAWEVDQQARDPHNPYNLIDDAQKIRRLRAGENVESAPPEAAPRPQGRTAPAPVMPPPPRVELAASDLRDIIRLVELQQQFAPAQLQVEDVRGRERFRIELAYSPAVEAEVQSDLGLAAESSRALLFTVHTSMADSFQPNFFIVQDALTFRPDPTRTEEVGFFQGGEGAVAPGEILLGYIVIPEQFDPTRSMDLWWNDRSISAVLAPQ